MSVTSSTFDLNVQPGKPPVLEVEAVDDPASWAARCGQEVKRLAVEYGSVLVRRLPLHSVAQVEVVFRHLGDLMTEKEAFASRNCYAEGVYSSSKWPSTQPMCMHHELSYRVQIPSLMLFACLTAPASGGETPVADSHKVLDKLPADLVERFERTGWILTRNYNDEIGATLIEAFGTDDRQAIEDYCLKHNIKFEWRNDGSLRTWQRRSAIVGHPVNGERCWFNQIAFLNQWTLDPEVREFLVEMYGEDGLPFNTCFGDGEPIGADAVEAINGAYRSVTAQEEWQAGDLMLVDNIRTAHGTQAFKGEREVIVGLADSIPLNRCKPTISPAVADI